MIEKIPALARLPWVQALLAPSGEEGEARRRKVAALLVGTLTGSPDPAHWQGKEAGEVIREGRRAAKAKLEGLRIELERAKKRLQALREEHPDLNEAALLERFQETQGHLRDSLVFFDEMGVSALGSPARVFRFFALVNEATGTTRLPVDPEGRSGPMLGAKAWREHQAVIGAWFARILGKEVQDLYPRSPADWTLGEVDGKDPSARLDKARFTRLLRERGILTEDGRFNEHRLRTRLQEASHRVQEGREREAARDQAAREVQGL